MIFDRTAERKYLGVLTKIKKPVNVESVDLRLRKANLITRNEERCFLAEGCRFHLDEFFTSVRLIREHVKPKSVSLSYRNVFNFLRKFLGTRLYQTPLLILNNKLLTSQP